MSEENDTVKSNLLTVIIRSPLHGEKDEGFKVKIANTDTFNDVKQYLLELGISNQPLTCFSLFSDNEKIDLFSPIIEIFPDLEDDATINLRIVPDAYTENESKYHIIQVRDYLGFNLAANDSYTSVQPGVSNFVNLESSLSSSANDVKKAIDEAQVEFEKFEKEKELEDRKREQEKKEEKKEEQEKKDDEQSSKPDETKPDESSDREKTPTVNDFIDSKTLKLHEQYITTHPFIDLEENISTYSPTLNELVPQIKKDPAPAVRSLQLSQWNPPPPQLKLKGDLLYLHLVTLEGKTFHITASIYGFHVSNSTTEKFDPSPKKFNGKYYKNTSLLDLLTSLSPGIVNHLKKKSETNASLLTSVKPTNAFLSNPWLVYPTDQSTWVSPDLARTQEVLSLNSDNTENSKSVRDWNEDLQSTRELPKVDEEGHNSIQDRIIRERLLNKLSYDFAEAAVKGAIAIVNGDLIALNANERPEAQIFLNNGIFYSYGADGVGTFADQGGDDCARAAAGKDVAGVNYVTQLDIDGLCPLCTTVVDYCGRRIVAQAPVPGIFRETTEDKNQIVYGSIDNGDKIVNDETFVSVMEKIADACHVAPHIAYDNNGNSTSLVTSSEVKGLLGTDGRKYVLDLYRITPPDLPFIEKYFDNATDNKYFHRMAVLRLEAVDEWWKSGLRVKFTQLEESRKKKSEGEGEGDVEADAEKPELTEEELKAQREEEESIIAEHSKSVRFNPDVLLDISKVPAEDIEQYKKDQQQVRDISTFVTETIIPKLIADIVNSAISTPVSSSQVTSILHKRGINLRYLGLISNLVEKEGEPLKAFKSLLTHEAIIRSIKHIVHNLIATLPTAIVPFAITHYFNCLFGYKVNDSPIAQVDEELLNLYPSTDISFTKLDIASVRNEISNQVLRRFQITLAANWIDEFTLRYAFRELSIKLGLQWISKNYDFENKNPIATSPRHLFIPSDLINIVPVFKYSTFKSQMAEEALESGRLSILRNDKEIGVELLAESLSLHEQVYGVIHPDVARAYSQVALVYHELGEDSIAIELGLKAIIIAERTLGIDSSDTLFMCLNLALFEHTNKNTIGALHISKYALKLWNSITIPEHPDHITTLNNVATMLYHMKAHASSLKWYQACIDLGSKIYGENSPIVAQFYFHMSQPQVLLREFKAAINSVRKSHDIFNSNYGPDNQNTKDVKQFLDHLIQTAVNEAKIQKIMPRLQKARESMNSLVTETKKSNLEKASNEASLKEKGSLGDKSINELLNYINGPSSKSKSKKKSKKAKSTSA